MKNKINLVELLKDCPKGMELDCTIYDGKVYFDGFDHDNTAYPIKISINSEFIEHLNIYGQYNTRDYAKCVIFPKGKTTWEGFVPPSQFKDGDIVFSGASLISIFKGIKKGYCGSLHSYVSVGKNVGFNIDKDCWTLENIRLATEEEKEKLFQAIKDNGYRWDEETKTLEKFPKFKVGDRIRQKGETSTYTITDVNNAHYFCGKYVICDTCDNDWELAPNKFDITTLVPFESKVLVRAVDNQFWRPAIWGVKHRDWDFCCVLGGEMWEQCIPYEGNEHLLGTNNDCDEYYKTWE